MIVSVVSIYRGTIEQS